MNQGGTNTCVMARMEGVLSFFFLVTVVSFPDGIKADFLRQLRLPAAHSPLQREEEEGEKKAEQLFGDEGMAK